MTPTPITTHPNATLKDAAKLMKEFNVGMIPVMDHENADQVIGVITDRDIVVRCVAEGYECARGVVRDAMSSPVHSCPEDQPIDAAVRLMEEKQIRRLLVMNDEGHLVGIVSLGDLAFKTEDERLAGEVLEFVSEPGQADAA